MRTKARLKRHSPVWRNGHLRDSFAVDEWTGQSCFMADGPAKRFDIPRIDMELTPAESTIVSNGRSGRDFQEERLQRDVARLMEIGVPLGSTKSLEEYVANHADLLREQV